MPLIVNQVEIHLGRLDCFYDGTLDQCLRQNMTPLAWSPLGGDGSASGRVDAADPHATTQETPDRRARCRSPPSMVFPGPVIALAWLLKHPSR